MNQVFLNPIIVAIDKNSETEAYQLTKELVGYVGAIKLGLEFFDTYGPDGIRNLQKLKIPIFLDLKIHDIPQTVKKTIDTLSSLKPDILNVHALGGKKMMQFALESLLNNSPNTQLVAVTILTSLDDDDLQMMEMNISTKNLVSSLAKLTKETGLSGVVCSSEEIFVISVNNLVPLTVLLFTPVIVSVWSLPSKSLPVMVKVTDSLLEEL